MKEQVQEVLQLVRPALQADGGARRNEKGELVKRPFGPWMRSGFKLLARLKGLRGSALDPFGRTEERRTERVPRGEPGKPDGEHQTEADIELPECRHLAAEKKPSGKRQAADNRNLLDAKAIEQKTDHRRK